MKTIILVANDDEANHLKELVFNHTPDKPVCILITGEGRSNVIETLTQKIKDETIEPFDRIINVGFVGGYGFNKGDVVHIDSVQPFIPSITIPENPIELSKNVSNFEHTKCYTADNFVSLDDYKINNIKDNKCVFDMELYWISLMFPEVISYKIVSDTLNYDEYKQANFNESWELVEKELKGIINE